VRMAAQMFHAMPERIEKMVLFGGPVRLRCAPDYPIGYTEDYVAMLEQTMLAPDHRSAVRSLLEAAFSEPGLSGWREVALEWWMTISADTYRQFVREVIEADARHLLPGINVPTLVIAAEGDILIPLPFVQYVAEHIPGALFARIKGSSHAAPWTAIGTFCEIVTTFIRTGSLPRTEWEP
jgi:pimeloyl-ACP methyl ester carboxylesterase